MSNYNKFSKQVLVQTLEQFEAVYGEKSVAALIARVHRADLTKRLAKIQKDTSRLTGIRHELMMLAERQKDVPALRYDTLKELRKVMDEEHRLVELHEKLYKELMGG